MVELALILPLLSFMTVATTDFARAFHDFVIVTDRARSAALYASQNVTQTVGTVTSAASDSAWTSGIVAAALADSAENLGPTQITVTPGQLSTIPASNPYVTVTVASTFTTIMTYPGIPQQTAISRTFRMRLQPTAYRMQ